VAFARIFDFGTTFRLVIDGGEALIFNDVRIVSNRNLNEGTWNFIAINVDALSVSWVINAGETGNRGSGTLSNPIAATSAIGYLGYGVNNAHDFKGAMSDVRFYFGQNLTSSEIDDLYALRNKPMAGTYTTFLLPTLPSPWVKSPSIWTGGIQSTWPDGTTLYSTLGYLSSFGRRWTSQCSLCDVTVESQGHAVILSTAMTGDFECIISYGSPKVMVAMFFHENADPADYSIIRGYPLPSGLPGSPMLYDPGVTARAFNWPTKTYQPCCHGTYENYTSGGTLYWQYKRVGTQCTIKYRTTSTGDWTDFRSGSTALKVLCMIGTSSDNRSHWAMRDLDATIVSCSTDSFT
jgi:hypothetical protein